MAENKKSGKGLVITLIVLLVAFAACAALLFTGVIKSPMVKCEEKTTEKTNTKTDSDTKKDSKVEDTSLEEGYVLYDKDHKVYGIYNYVELASLVVGYNGDLYYIAGGDSPSSCVLRVGEVSYDQENKATCDMTSIETSPSQIMKYNGKEKDLAKVVYRVPIGSTSGFKNPILIFKDGSIETTNQQTANALKDYKIKDFIEEKCVEHPTDGSQFPGDCLKGEYKVVLQDGTEKTIEVTYGE